MLSITRGAYKIYYKYKIKYTLYIAYSIIAVKSGIKFKEKINNSIYLQIHNRVSRIASKDFDLNPINMYLSMLQ